MNSLSENNLDVKISVILSIIYIFINIYYKKLLIIIIFIVIVIVYGAIVVTFYGSDNIGPRIPIIVAFSILISFIFSLLFSSPYQEDFTNKDPQKKKKKKKSSPSKDVVYDNDDTDNFVGNNHIDLGTSFLEAYKNLDKSQISSMTKDTKELIKTQKTLMSTLENLAPVVKEGKSIIDTFKGYFDGDDSKKS
mgnify:FL=1